MHGMNRKSLKWTKTDISLCNVRKKNDLSCRDCVLYDFCDKKDKYIKSETNQNKSS